MRVKQQVIVRIVITIGLGLGFALPAAATSIVASDAFLSPFGDRSTGAGQLVVANGATTAGNVIWSGPVAVDADTEYYSSAWMSSNHGADIAPLAFSINGVAVATPFTSARPDHWRHSHGPWPSGDPELVLALVEHDAASGGHDSAIDDFALDMTVPLTANPEPASLTLLATGLFGAAAMLRRRYRAQVRRMN